MLRNTFLLRLVVAVILLAHSIPSIVSNGVTEFGNLYLNQVGFAPLGLPIAWAIKLSHVASAVCLLLNKYVRPAAIITIVILIAGIVMIHAREGWFVVGFGRNGVEFNVLLIAVLLTLIFPEGLKKRSS